MSDDLDEIDDLGDGRRLRPDPLQPDDPPDPAVLISRATS